MDRRRIGLQIALVALLAVVLFPTWMPALALATARAGISWRLGPGEALRVAQTHGTEDGELRPRYEPVAPQPKSSYTTGYLFGMTRGVAESTLHPGVKVPLFVITVPLDIVFLPFTAIGGFFG